MLNEKQQEAVEIINKPLVVIAGPGTGKTALITEKIDFLIKKQNMSEDSILALTFTQKAAEEMSNRVENKIGRLFTAKTFHSFALELLDEFKTEISEIGENYILIDETEQKLFFLENLFKFNLCSVEIRNNSSDIANEFQSVISKLKDFGMGLEELQDKQFEDEKIKADIISAYTSYEQYKKENNFIDFGDLLILLLKLLKTNMKIRGELKKRYTYTLVDEFQDTNNVQFEIVKLIAENNITIVGDMKQSIYAFRGADYDNLEKFKNHYKNHKEIFLSKNYRSSKKLIDNFNNFILRIANKNELLESTNNNVSELELIEAQSEDSQTSFIINKITQIKQENPKAKIGILFRRKSELAQVSSKLKSFGIKHSSVKTQNFYNFEITKEILFLLEIISNPKEANSQLYHHLSNSGLRSETVRKISRKASLKSNSIYSILLANLIDYEDEKTLVKTLIENIDSLIKLKDSKVPLNKLIFETVQKYGFYQKSIILNNNENISAINNFLRFVDKYSKIHKSPTLEEFIKTCNLSKDIDFEEQEEIEQNDISLLTVHQSKGKEFDCVIIPYLNERKFPSNFKQSKFDSLFINEKNEFLEEEKRLFFVAMTRAKTSLYIIYVKRYSENKFDSKPSQFIELLNIEKQIYNEKLETIKLDIKDEIKLEILKKIQVLLIQNQFDIAKKEIDLLKDLFGKKDLNNFITQKHPEFNFYKKRLENKNIEHLQVDISKMIYSVSQLKTYESCPKKYLFQYIYKIPTISKHYFDFGTSVHFVLEKLIPDFDMKLSKEVLFSKSINILHETWISKGYENSKQEREYFEKGLQAIKNFIEKEIELRKESKRSIVALEKKFLINLNGKRITGYIDRIEKSATGYEIFDYKTSNSMESDSQLKENMQLYVYAMALKELYGSYPETVGLWYLVHDKISLVKINTSMLEKIKTDILSLISSIEASDFTAKPSYFACKFCDFNNICPSNNKNNF